MARARLSYRVTDRAGNAVQNARVLVQTDGTSTPVADLFAAESGGVALDPAVLLSNAQGEIEGFLTVARYVKLTISDNSDAAYYPAAPANHLSFDSFDERRAAEPAPTSLAEHVSDPSAAHDATGISFDASAAGPGWSADNVQDAIEEAGSDSGSALASHLGDTSDAHDASAVSFAPEGSIGSTDVQAAIAELLSEVTAALALKLDSADHTKAAHDALLIDAATLEGSTKAQLQTLVIAAISDSAPALLDTLNELAAALGDDPNFATTVATSLATKATIAALTAETDARIAADGILQDAIDLLADDQTIRRIIGTTLGTSSIVDGNVVLAFDTKFGVDPEGQPYYNEAGPTPGEEAILRLHTGFAVDENDVPFFDPDLVGVPTVTKVIGG